jgi:pimeloyl-ACP methyl ester carboxylesterase
MQDDVRTTEKVVRDGPLELATEAFGDPAAPPVLLIMGAMASMLWWPEGLCRALAAQGRFVIRYDNRDTGRSTHWPTGSPDYSFSDMADDALRVLDGYGLRAAHVVGMSMGGMIAQEFVLDRPERVLSLTLISTSPVGEAGKDLPPSTQAYQAHAGEGASVDWSDRSQVVDYMVKEMRMIAGSAASFDAAEARAFVERDHDRAVNFASATNHFMLKEGRKVEKGLDALRMPLLVIHGTEDPIFPIAHGEALAKVVPGAKLVRLQGGGHEMAAVHWPEIVQAITGHTARPAA